MKETTEDIIVLHMCTKNNDHRSEIWCATDGLTDGQRDEWKKWHIQVGAPPTDCWVGSIKNNLHRCTINDNHMIYGSWDTEHDIQNFSHFGHFLPFYAPNNPKNQNFEKMKKTPGDITILHMCTINDNHMMYEKMKKMPGDIIILHMYQK